jgi:hypothetical protein
MANTFRGRAQVAGTSGTVAVADVAISILKEGMTLTHEFEEDIIKDEQGNDAAWRAFNEKYGGTLKLRLVITDDPNTFTRAKALAAVLTPLAKLQITNCDVSIFNTTFQIVSGSTLADLVNTTAGSASWNIRRYVDATQNTLAVTTPT